MANTIYQTTYVYRHDNMKSTVSFRTQRIEKMTLIIKQYHTMKLFIQITFYLFLFFVPNLKYDFIFMSYSIKTKQFLKYIKEYENRRSYVGLERQISFILWTNEIIQAERKRLQTLVPIQGHMFSCWESFNSICATLYIHIFEQKNCSKFCQMVTSFGKKNKARKIWMH